jgi:hypothetical protein
MTPGKAEEISLALDHIAYRVPKGHRLRIAISNAYWPLVWPAPEAGELLLSEGHLDLPVRPRAAAPEWAFPPPDSDAPWRTETLREASNSRRTETDLATGEIHLVIEDDFGKRRDSEHGLVSGSVARERWSIHPDDPLSARGSCHWTTETERDDIRLRTEASCEMWSDATHFHLRARMEAFENDTLVYERDTRDSIARECL